MSKKYKVKVRVTYHVWKTIEVDDKDGEEEAMEMACNEAEDDIDDNAEFQDTEVAECDLVKGSSTAAKDDDEDEDAAKADAEDADPDPDPDFDPDDAE